MTQRDSHLTEEEFADYLLGLSTAEARTHLLECGPCREEMEGFGASLASFNQSTLAWSREQAVAHPVQVKTQAVARKASSGWQAGWVVAVAAMLVFAVAVPLHQRARHSAVASRQGTAQPQEDAAGIAQDNQMMAAIAAEISQADTSPVESFATFRPQHGSNQDGQHAVRKKS